MRRLSVLVAFEFSARVRDAFIARGHDAWSCDLRPTEGRFGNHLQGDYRWAFEGRLDRFDAVDIRTGNRPLFRKWDMIISHPPCTRLANSGVRWLEERNLWKEMEDGARMFNDCLDAPAPHVVVENPIQHKHARRLIRKYDQIIQPWQFGDGATKATCIWLRDLPKLDPTGIVPKALRKAEVHREPPGPEREKNRSRTYPGIASAFAEQWGSLPI